MKRIYNYVKNLIVTRYKLMRFITFLLFLFSAISVLYHHVSLTAGAFFGGSLVTLGRLITYKTGKIPFARDHTLNGALRRSRRKNSDLTPDEVYEQTSLKLAAIHFIVAVVGFILWTLVELLVLFFSLF